MIAFRVYGLPVTEGSIKTIRHRWTRRAITIHDADGDLARWRRTVAVTARAAGVHVAQFDRADGIELSLTFRLPRPPSVRRKLPRCRPDLDKLIRAVCDALKGIAYADDGAVTDLGRVRKRYATLTEPAGVVIALAPVEED